LCYLLLEKERASNQPWKHHNKARKSEANLVLPPLSPASQAALLNAWWNPTKGQLAVPQGLFENGVLIVTETLGKKLTWLFYELTLKDKTTLRYKL
jgi:hypothetical protein